MLLRAPPAGFVVFGNTLFKPGFVESASKPFLAFARTADQ
jgi:hypothetical protein